MSTFPFKPKVFFAIPCGEFYTPAANAIKAITKVAGIDAIIVEDDPLTMGLWYKIAKQIESADLFVADISSQSPNILLELGYAMRGKATENIGIFVSATAPVPSDLQGFVYQRYSSYSEFKEKLIKWLHAVMPLIDQEKLRGLEILQKDVFYDDFKSRENFLRNWSYLPGSSVLLPLEGLRISNAPIPILTTSLGILRDCEFEFRARIDRNTIGWVVKGSRNFQNSFPGFCVMFNLNHEGNLLPHIWHQKHLDLISLYRRYFEREKKSVKINKNQNGWFTLITRVRGDVIEIDNGTETVFSEDFSKEPYAELYNDFPNKEGQVGFRCDSGEVATIQYVRVRELSAHSPATDQ